MAQQCKAKAKSTGKRCKNAAVSGRDVCRIHGGLTPRGPALPQFKHGRYSKFLAGGLTGRYEELLSNPEILALRDDIALVDTRLTKLVERLGSGETGSVWAQMHDAYRDLQAAIDAGDVKETLASLKALEILIREGGSEYAAWSEICELLEQRRRLVESERRRLVDMQQMLSTEQALGLLAAVVDTVRRHVQDKSALAAISADIERLAAGQNGRGAGSDA